MGVIDKEKAAVGMKFEENPLGFKKADIHFEEKILKFENESGAFVIGFGEASCEQIAFPGTNFKTLSRGEWEDDNSFNVSLQVTEGEPAEITFKFVFLEDKSVTLLVKNDSESQIFDKYNGMAKGNWRIKRKVWTNRKNMVR